MRRTGANALALVGGGADLLALSAAGAVLAGKLTGVAAQTLGPVFAAYGGTANAIALTYGVAAVTIGTAVRFKASATNTGAATINLDGKGAIACRTITGAVLPSGYIRTDTITTAVYDGTFWVVNREIERGANANGEFVRFASGVMICHNFTAISDAVATAAGVLFQSAAPAAWVFPATFATIPVVTATSRQASSRWATVVASTTTSADIRVISYASSAVSTGVSGLAVGNWY